MLFEPRKILLHLANKLLANEVPANLNELT